MAEHISTKELTGVEDMCFYSVFWAIKHYAIALIPDPRGMPDTYSDARKPGLKLPEKALRTLELMPQYRVALRTWENISVCKHDEISSGIQHILQNPEKTPLWATFGVDLFLDIQSVLGDKQSKPFYEIDQEADAWYNRSLRPDGIWISDRPARNEAIELIIRHIYPAVKLDPFVDYAIYNEPGKKRTASTTTTGFWELFKEEKNYFMKRHPRTTEQHKNMTWLAHLYVAGRVLDLQAPRWPDMEFSIQRQGVDHLFGTDGLPTTLAECKSKLKKANGFNTSNGRYRANRARYFRNPRVLGNILAGQMDDSTQQESIYHVLRSFICDPADQAQLFRQCNVPAGTAQSDPSFQLHLQPRYASLLQDLGTYWLPADLVDLYFDWMPFTRHCDKLARKIREHMCRKTDCPITENNTDLFGFALWMIDLAIKDKWQHAKMIAHPEEFLAIKEHLGEADFQRLMGQSHVRLHLRRVNAILKEVSQTVIADGRVKMYQGDAALVELMERGAPKDFFLRDGPASASKLYDGWKREQRRSCEFWMTHMR